MAQTVQGCKINRFISLRDFVNGSIQNRGCFNRVLLCIHFNKHVLIIKNNFEVKCAANEQFPRN
jgi:hypothetical protein